MTLETITNQVHQLGNAWENFKQVNDTRLAEIEKKGAADPLYLEHLSKIGAALDHHKNRIDAIETADSRPITEIGAKASVAEHGEYKAALRNYLRKGMEAGLESLELKSLSVGTPADGGYLVTPQMSEQIIQIVQDASPLRSLATVTEISSDSLDVIEDDDVMAATWAGETGTRDDTTTAQIGKQNIPTFEMYSQPKATQKLVDDAAIDIESWVAQKVGEQFARLESAAFFGGNGTSQPKGLLTYTAGTAFGQIEQIDSGTDGVVTADGLVELYYALKDEYAKNATFLMRRSVIQSVRLLKESSTDQYIWQPGLAQGTPDSLLGVPVREAADVPAAANDALSVAIGDFKRAYQIVDRAGVRILRDPFTSKPFIRYYTTKRVGGEVVNTEAVKLLKLAA